MRKTAALIAVSLAAAALLVSCEDAAANRETAGTERALFPAGRQERNGRGEGRQERRNRRFSEEEVQNFRENHRRPFMERMREENPGLSDEQIMALLNERFMELMRRRHPEMSEEQLNEMLKERFSAPRGDFNRRQRNGGRRAETMPRV